MCVSVDLEETRARSEQPSVLSPHLPPAARTPPLHATPAAPHENLSHTK